MKALLARPLLACCAVLLSACASAPQPYCIPPEFSRAPESSGPFGPIPRAPSNADEEYARCKERERERNDEERLDAQLREDEARARKREAEQLEQELREMQEKDPEKAK
jgi:hypothetical protein